MSHKNQIAEDSKPPVQNALGLPPCYPFACSPFYRFVSVRQSEHGIDIWESQPSLEVTDLDDGTYVENVDQNYTLNVPCADQTDGESPVTFRAQHRTRTVPIRKRRAKPLNNEESSVEQTYTVNVPYSEVIDGIAISCSRLESQTRQVPENEVPQILVPVQLSKSYPTGSFRIYDVGGRELDAESVLGSVDGCWPAIQIADPSHIVPYFAGILKPETKFVVTDV